MLQKRIFFYGWERIVFYHGCLISRTIAWCFSATVSWIFTNRMNLTRNIFILFTGNLLTFLPWEFFPCEVNFTVVLYFPFCEFGTMVLRLQTLISFARTEGQNMVCLIRFARRSEKSDADKLPIECQSTRLFTHHTHYSASECWYLFVLPNENNLRTTKNTVLYCTVCLCQFSLIEVDFSSISNCKSTWFEVTTLKAAHQPSHRCMELGRYRSRTDNLLFPRLIPVVDLRVSAIDPRGNDAHSDENKSIGITWWCF